MSFIYYFQCERGIVTAQQRKNTINKKKFIVNIRLNKNDGVVKKMYEIINAANSNKVKSPKFLFTLPVVPIKFTL